MRIAVILVNYNGKQYNEACIETLLSQKRFGKDVYTMKIYVVDNASRDGSMQIIQERYGGDGRIETIFLMATTDSPMRIMWESAGPENGERIMCCFSTMIRRRRKTCWHSLWPVREGIRTA